MARVSVRVKPGASRARVGGAYGEPAALVVAVNAPPVDGRANVAVVKALADAFGVRPADVTVVAGHQGRTKVIEIDADDAVVAARLTELLAAD